MNFKQKNNQGITLIVLVITIVALLILAGVTIATLRGEDDIIEEALEAKETTKESASEEKSEAQLMDDTMYELMYRKPSKVRDEKPGVLEGDSDETEEIGTESNPYQISSIEDLVAFSNQVNGGNSFSGKYIKLMKSLDFDSDNSYVDPTTKEFGDVNLDGKKEGLKVELSKGQGFVPIGNYNSNPVPFAGTFLGNEKYIKNLYINVADGTGEFDTGLFGYNTGTIQDVYVLDCDINVETYYAVVGGVVGVQDGKVMRCSISGKVKGESNGIGFAAIVGGIGGVSTVEGENAQIESCYNLAEVVSINNDTESIPETPGMYYNNSAAGGILGEAYLKSQTISNCYNMGKIASQSKQAASAGGIVGVIGGDSNNSTIGIPGFEHIKLGGDLKNSYNAGIVEAKGELNSHQGSVVGDAQGNANINNIYGIGNNQIIGTVGTDKDYPNTITNAEIKTSTQLKSSDIISLLGDGFKKDSGKKNSGYPLLAWQ